MADYTVTRISDQAPREYYSEKYGTTTYYIKVMLDGHAKPVSVGKKTPDGVKVGDILSGTIVPTEYDADKFQAERKPFTPGAAGGGGNFRDQDSIKAQWAIRQAVAMALSDKPFDLAAIEVNARDLFEMVERVKADPPGPGWNKAKAAADSLKQPAPAQPSPPAGLTAFFSDGTPVPTEPATDEIPF